MMVVVTSSSVSQHPLVDGLVYYLFPPFCYLDQVLEGIFPAFAKAQGRVIGACRKHSGAPGPKR